MEGMASRPGGDAAKDPPLDLADAMAGRRFEVLQAHHLEEQRLYWQRFYIFAALHAGLLVLATSNTIRRPWVINCLGAMLGLIWVLVQWASRYYAKRLQPQYYQAREEIGIRPPDHWLFSRRGLASTDLALYAALAVFVIWLLMAVGLVT